MQSFISDSVFLAALENTNDIVFALTATGEFAYVSPNWRETFGYEVEEVLNKPFAPVVHPDDVLGCVDFLKRVFETGVKQTGVQYRVKCKNGPYVWYMANGSLIQTQKGVPLLLGVGHDINSRKQATQEMTEQHEFLQAITRSVHDAIVVLTGTGEITFWNEAAEHLFDYTAEEMLGKIFQKNLLSSSDESAFQELYEGLNSLERNSSSGSCVELHAYKKNRKEFPVELCLSPLKRNGCLSAVATIRDCTDRKERELINKKLGQTEKLASIGLLAAGVVHEINSPLTILSGMNSMMEEALERGDNSKVSELLEKQSRATQRITTIVNGLRTYARADTEKDQLLDCNSVISETLSFVESIYKKEGVELVFFSQAKKDQIFGNVGKLQQVLLNLLGNARDATVGQPKRVIQLRTEETPTHIILSVADNGCGISAENMKNLFQPFFTTKDAGKGTGLGLSISREIITGMKGSIQVMPNPGGGTCFTVTLPLSH